jgi:type II secretory pathway pseudopilin PulG
VKRVRTSGFTVVEMLIAVGAVALIGVGLAQLFERTGDTVRTGRRVSANNEYAALLERTLRADLRAITRNGFLVIRHREVGAWDTSGPLTGAGSGILLSPTDRDPTPRRRRVDQLAFFVEGRASSLRDPLHPDKYPTGSASRVWYGHGLSRPDDPAASLTDDNSAASTFGRPGAAQFAGAWTLVRHQTVLARPQIGSEAPSSAVGVVPPALAAEWDDSAVQVGMQPASPSIFRNERLQAIGAVDWARIGDARPSEQPDIASGLVDVASMDLSQVRARVLAIGVGAGAINPRGRNLLPISTIDPPPVAAYAPGLTAAEAMKDLMAFSLPAGIRADDANPPDPALVSGAEPERRIRAEPTPPDYLGTVSGAPFTESWQRTDQLMLASGNLIPGCTEFIVEWSFGVRYPASDPLGRAGQLIWHGLPRYMDLDADGQPDVTDPAARVADIYLGESAANNSATRSGDRLVQAFTGLLDDGSGRYVPGVYTRPVASELIHLPTNAEALNGAWPEGRALYSCFGYVDPTYARGPLPVLGTNNTRFTTTPDPTQPDALEWPWPRLLRVTISLTDPSEPDVEQTYQFVFDLPQRDNGL